MTISVNDQLQEIPDQSSVLQLLQSMEISHLGGLAIAVNNCIIRKENWPSQLLQPNDILVLIRASQGG